MAYTLQALIGDRQVLSGAQLEVPAHAFVPLPQLKAMLPLTSFLLERFAIPLLPLTDAGPDFLPPGLDELGRRASQDGAVAYVEAEFFGGMGAQATVVWERGNIVFGPVVAEGAVNEGLKRLGVTRDSANDEFDALQLGAHRATDDWSSDD